LFFIDGKNAAPYRIRLDMEGDALLGRSSTSENVQRKSPTKENFGEMVMGGRTGSGDHFAREGAF
tara:strand:+ start:752 stop:946 length:195 start_codon:yes stop_codon:yes gene_type:complete